jgi:hypothetical protein
VKEIGVCALRAVAQGRGAADGEAMQIIVEVEVEAGLYASEQYQIRIKAPSLARVRTVALRKVWRRTAITGAG